jgi:hypothetical protein
LRPKRFPQPIFRESLNSTTIPIKVQFLIPSLQFPGCVLNFAHVSRQTLVEKSTQSPEGAIANALIRLHDVWYFSCHFAVGRSAARMLWG